MKTPEQETELKLKQARVVLVLNLLMTLFCLTVFIKSIDAGVTWKIVFSGAGLVVFTALCTALYLRVRTLNKAQKG
jgi:hypothetical protein